MRINTTIALLLLGSTVVFPIRAQRAEISHLPEGAGRVLIVKHSGATQSFNAQSAPVQQMVREALRKYTAKPNVREAWLSLLSLEDVVGIKVHSSPGANSGTRPTVVAALIETLLEAGFSPSKIVVWDKRISDLRQAGYFQLAEKYQVRISGSAEAGYDSNVFYESSLLGRLVYGDLEFGTRGEGVGRKSFVSKLLTREITKIINVPPLLNHNVVGVSGILHGLAMCSVDNSLRFDLSPEQLGIAVPEIFALEQLTERCVLNLVDALICQYEGEERSLLHYSIPLNELWVSADPVALDALALAEMEKQRTNKDRPPPKIANTLLENAALLELGIADLKQIRVERFPLE